MGNYFICRREKDGPAYVEENVSYEVAVGYIKCAIRTGNDSQFFACRRVNGKVIDLTNEQLIDEYLSQRNRNQSTGFPDCSVN